MTTLDVVFVASYVSLLCVLSAMALHRLLLSRAARRLVPVARRLGGDALPTVLVQVPLYNERNVAERVIDAVCRLDYPHEGLAIQILDDSTDGSSALIAAAVQTWAERGLPIEHLRRTHRAGFKAGALAAGLEQSDAELVAIFDADFVPQPDFLKRMVPAFHDQRVGMAQARWTHLNRHDSPLTEAEAVLLDGHFVNEHGGRFVSGCFFNFNGTCGVWRREAILSAGNWSGQTLTEDLDLSYRAQLCGWRFVYLPDVTVPGELPADVQAFKAQQHRWAKGSIETARLLLRRIWAAPLSFKIRFEATLHLAANFAYPLVLLMTLLLPYAVIVRLSVPRWTTLLVDLVLFAGSTVSLVVFYLRAEYAVGEGRKSIRHLPYVLALGIGMAVNNTRAVLEAMSGYKSPFNRTPKRGDKGAMAPGEPRLSPRALWQARLELALGAYMMGGALFAIDAGRFVAVPFFALFSWGFLSLALGSLWPQDAEDGAEPGKSLTAPAVAKRI